MPRIFELFGFRVGDQSKKAKAHRQAATCPFADCDCDGGGNRYLSNVDLHDRPELRDFFLGRETVPSGVCSLQLTEDARPWIVCPRRLLVLSRPDMGRRAHQEAVERKLFEVAGYSAGTRLAVWPEVKMTYAERRGTVRKTFDYTFDYVLIPVATLDQARIEEATGKNWDALRPLLTAAGYAVASCGGREIIEDFPDGPPLIVEIMTSSTSGGNKRVRSTIPMAFEDAIMGAPHKAPGINYRQVWARMVSQLVVKSEVALGWGGKAIWILQDALVDYIRASTALDIGVFRARTTSEVNILSFSYGESFADDRPGEVIELAGGQLYAGPISQSGGGRAPSFQDIIRAPVKPPLSRLLALLAARRPTSYITVR